MVLGTRLCRNIWILTVLVGLYTWRCISYFVCQPSLPVLEHVCRRLSSTWHYLSPKQICIATFKWWHIPSTLITPQNNSFFHGNMSHGSLVCTYCFLWTFNWVGPCSAMWCELTGQAILGLYIFEFSRLLILEKCLVCCIVRTTWSGTKPLRWREYIVCTGRSHMELNTTEVRDVFRMSLNSPGAANGQPQLIA